MTALKIGETRIISSKDGVVCIEILFSANSKKIYMDINSSSVLTVGDTVKLTTSSNGGHHDNKNASGLGSYHYHCDGNPSHLHEDGVCPYSSSSSTSSSFSKATSSSYTKKVSKVLSIFNSEESTKET